ncbi:MAG: MFS transporter [Aliidongia sp.]
MAGRGSGSVYPEERRRENPDATFRRIAKSRGLVYRPAGGNAKGMPVRTLFKPTQVVLALLCVMYFITYIDRVNIGTAASDIQHELGLTNTQLGFVFSAFAYPYLAFQVVGGWVGDRFGPRRTLVWCGVIWAVATILTGVVHGLFTLFLARLLLGFGEGATFPTATRAMQYWTPADKRGFAQGLTHSFARLGNAVTPPLIAALMAAVTWRGSFMLLGVVSLIWVSVWAWYFRNEPKDHPSITAEELATLPKRVAGARQPPVPWGTAAAPHGAGDLHLFLLRLEPVALSQLAAAVLQEQLPYGTEELGAVLLGRLLRRGGRRYAWRRRLRRHPAAHRQCPAGPAERDGRRLHRRPAVAAADPVRARHHHRGALPVRRLLLRRAGDRADVVGADGYRAEILRHRLGADEYGLSLRAIVSPLVAGYVIDLTENWYLPFLMSMGLLLLGALSAFLMHPERPFDSHDEPIAFPPDSKMAAD